MNKVLIKILIFFLLTTNQSISEENIMILKLKDGEVKIELFPDKAQLLASAVRSRIRSVCGRANPYS